jgi:hypothetical protein
MGRQEDIDRLRKEAANTKNKIVLLNIIDKLGESANTPYSNIAIDAICFIIATQKEKDVKVFGLDMISRMREGKNNFKVSKFRNFTE